jgi:ABC-type multidrug transport system fused ATPase/permease subunit
MICDKASTAIYFDRVLVFKQGKLVEDGHPVTLLNQKNGKKSVFSDLISKEKVIF